MSSLLPTLAWPATSVLWPNFRTVPPPSWDMVPLRSSVPERGSFAPRKLSVAVVPSVAREPKYPHLARHAQPPQQPTSARVWARLPPSEMDNTSIETLPYWFAIRQTKRHPRSRL